MNLLSHSHNPTAGGFHRLGDADWNAFSGGRGYSPRRGSPLGWPERLSARNSIIKKVSSEMRGISTGGDSQRVQAQFGEIPKPTAWPGREKNVFGAVPEAVFCQSSYPTHPVSVRSCAAPDAFFTVCQTLPGTLRRHIHQRVGFVRVAGSTSQVAAEPTLGYVLAGDGVGTKQHRGSEQACAQHFILVDVDLQ